MRIAVYGTGNVGGGLADLWERKGHQVSRIGRDGGDVSQAEVIVLAIPGDKLGEALDKVKGIQGKTVIDATNLIKTKAPGGFNSNAEFVKSKTKGPTAKSFNINFASLYGQVGTAHVKPSNLWSGDEEARRAVEQLSKDAGYDPVFMGPLSNSALLEGMIGPVFAIAQAFDSCQYPVRVKVCEGMCRHGARRARSRSNARRGQSHRYVSNLAGHETVA